MIIAALFTFSQIAFAGPSGVDVKAGNQMSGMLFKENHSLNAGFEANNENNVTDSSGIATVTSTSPISGNYSLAIDATTSGELVKILGKTIKQVGTSCEAVFYYTGDASLYKAYVLQGATKVSQELTLSNVGTNVQPVSLIFPCGSGTAPDVTIESTGNGAAIKVDDFYSGMPVNIGTVAQAQLLGTLSYATTSGCNWSTSSTSFTNFTADSDCPTPIVTGQITAPGTKVPGFSIASLAPGSLMIVPQATLYKTTTTDSVCSFRLSDGTNTTTATNIYTGTAAPFGTSSSYQFTYTTAQSNLTVQFQALSQSGSSTCGIDNGTSPRATSFDVYYFPSQSQTVVSTQQAEYDWRPWVPTFVGGGSVTIGNANDCQEKREGGDNLISCKFILGTTTGSTFTMSLPNGNAVRTGFAPNIRPVGDYTRGGSQNNKGGRVLALDADTVLKFSISDYIGSTAADGSVPVGGTSIGGSGNAIYVTARVPIQGWINYPFPLIPQSVTNSSSGVSRVESAEITNNGSTCSVFGQLGDWIASATNSGGGGGCTIVFKAGTFSAKPYCSCTTEGSNAAAHSCYLNTGITNDNTQVAFITTDNNTNTARAFQMTCVGPR